ncbi:KpsF/GutQ family sugar-phosphate isomerase [Bacteriovorax stolpii]|uniref:KpsF/GutQ family sugar-phosphate isomerase n=1 Tax=Bacteriovorax stolpii TaxID=960 RepID=A0A2K9NNM5_BACTC|nr:KpsF/GutQ family sugar-phosphate isomerase [Bacteriovorax stolpii]AUN97098.1 KpsF/GutQ family sugar-phosphate isomerase [Bacteriovorax stolpii]QDK42967.1 KpsF/GutQ family sugar-phosphate isomerase [Bacteriovorax stolpii]TDP53384.1 arabinose-5-phosphate isomerase [Bacteriovorax stolpii]
MTHSKTMADVLKLEAESLLRAAEILEKNHSKDADKLTNLFDQLRATGSSIIFCGVGKSGIIAQKCAASFTSLGLPALFLHPTEALHGDLGRVGKNDAIVLLSKSGTTEEVLKLMPFLQIPRSHRIALVGKVPSPISEYCDIIFDCSVEKEACINNQAPTTSSTLALAMGDAMAVLFEKYIGLSKEGFAVNHPGGILGKSLRMKVRDLTIKEDQCPVLKSTQTLQDAILMMTKFPVGGCAVVDNGEFKGILVEGDIRRTFTRENQGLQTSVESIMNRTPTSIHPDQLAFEALELMESKTRSFQILPVLEGKKFLGFIRLHDLLKEGFSLKG